MPSPFARVAAVGIGTDAVRIAVIETRFRTVRLLDFASAPVEETPDESWEDAVVRALRDTGDALETRPDTFVLALPMAWSVLRTLTVPFRNARKIAAAVPFELEPTLAIPIEDLVIDHLRSRTSGKTATVLAAGVGRAALEKHIELLDRAGIAVEGACLDGLGALSLWAFGNGHKDEPVALLCFSGEDAVLGVVEGERLTTLRRVDATPRTFRTDPKAVARTVQNILRAHAAEHPDGQPVGRLAVAGTDEMEASRTVFAGCFEIPIDYVDPLDKVRGAETLDDVGAPHGNSGGAWMPLLGVALNAAGGPFHLNLFDPAYTGASAKRSLARAVVVGCVAASTVLVVFLAAAYFDYRRHQARLGEIGDAIWREFEATYPELASERPSNDPGGASTLEMMQLAAEEESSESFGVSLDTFQSPPLVNVLLEIARRLPEPVAAVRQISMRRTNDGHEVTLSGEIRNPARYEEALNAFDADPAVRVDRDRSTRTSEGGRETFALRLRM